MNFTGYPIHQYYKQHGSAVWPESEILELLETLKTCGDVWKSYGATIYRFRDSSEVHVWHNTGYTSKIQIKFGTVEVETWGGAKSHNHIATVEIENEAYVKAKQEFEDFKAALLSEANKIEKWGRHLIGKTIANKRGGLWKVVGFDRVPIVRKRFAMKSFSSTAAENRKPQKWYANNRNDDYFVMPDELKSFAAKLMLGTRKKKKG